MFPAAVGSQHGQHLRLEEVGVDRTGRRMWGVARHIVEDQLQHHSSVHWSMRSRLMEDMLARD